MEIRFLHTSDWHLGANLASFSPEKAAFRRETAFSSISKMIAQSLAEKIDVVLISGDIFDNPNPSEKIKKTFRSLVNPLMVANKPIFAIPGNHDYYVKDGLWDRNEFPFLHVFRDEGFSYFNLAELNLTVWGVPVLSSNQDKDWLKFPPGIDINNLNILIYHGDYRGTGREYEQWYHPFDLADIAGNQFDYIALGHHHAKEEIKAGNRIKAVYPGSPIGWTFRKNECGRRYYVLGKISESEIEIEIRELHGSEMRMVDVNLNYPSEINKAINELESFSNDDFVRLKVSGTDDSSDFLIKIEKYNSKFRYFKAEYDESSLYASDISENQHLQKLLKLLDSRLEQGNINEDFHSRLKSRAIKLFMR
jgi:DNA repair exonuclease SbcCD nuclease subunit